MAKIDARKTKLAITWSFLFDFNKLGVLSYLYSSIAIYCCQDIKAKLLLKMFVISLPILADFS